MVCFLLRALLNLFFRVFSINLSLLMTPFGVFPDYFSLNHFLAPLCRARGWPQFAFPEIAKIANFWLMELERCVAWFIYIFWKFFRYGVTVSIIVGYVQQILDMEGAVPKRQILKRVERKRRKKWKAFRKAML